jgi:hypothetical protein
MAQPAQPTSQTMVKTCSTGAAHGLDVVHPDVAHTHPHVVEQATMTEKVSTFIHCAEKMPAQLS